MGKQPGFIIHCRRRWTMIIKLQGFLCQNDDISKHSCPRNNPLYSSLEAEISLMLSYVGILIQSEDVSINRHGIRGLPVNH
jgi:hypothetical protein